MDHPSLDSLDQYAADKVKYYIEHGSAEYQELEEHLARCDECGGYVDLSLLPKKAQIQKDFRDLEESLKARGVVIPTRYQNGKACLDEERLAAYISGVLPFWSVWKVKRHLQLCTYCASAVQGVWEPAGVDSEKSGYIFIRSKWHIHDLFRNFQMKPLRFAVMFVAVVIVGALYFLSSGDWSSRFRGRSSVGQDVIRLVKPRPGQTVDISDFDFLWRLTQDVVGARYEVVIWDTDVPGDSKRFPTTNTKLSASEVDILQRGKTYRWMVVVYEGEKSKIKSGEWVFHTR